MLTVCPLCAEHAGFLDFWSCFPYNESISEIGENSKDMYLGGLGI